MRIWDMMDPHDLCDNHLRAQWAEGLGLWSILTNGKAGYRNHPETRRWQTLNHRIALASILLHTRMAMLARGWNPKPLPASAQPYAMHPSSGIVQEYAPPPWDDQLATLASKRCDCRIPQAGQTRERCAHKPCDQPATDFPENDGPAFCARHGWSNPNNSVGGRRP